jgi:hypothetical protein
MKILFAGLSLMVVAGCASRSVTADKSDVKVSREEPAKDCTEVGNLRGTTLSAKGTQAQALEDLKQEAANKGANYVVVKQYSDNGTSVTGVGYICR